MMTTKSTSTKARLIEIGSLLVLLVGSVFFSESANGDELEAIRAKANAGDAWAQYNVGLMYLMGAGVAKDHAEAAKWYRKAAEQGDANAQYSLGVMYGTGEGVVESNVNAHMWLNLARAQGGQGG